MKKKMAMVFTLFAFVNAAVVAERLRSYANAFEEELARNSRPAGVAEHPKPLTK